MGRADNRRTPKSLRRKAQRRKKLRIKKRIGLGKAKSTDTKKVKVRQAAAVATPVAPAKPATRKATTPKETAAT